MEKIEKKIFQFERNNDIYNFKVIKEISLEKLKVVI